MQQTNRSVRLAVGIILPRLQDEDDVDGGVAKEERRTKTNQLLKKMCKERMSYLQISKMLHSPIAL